MTAVVFKRSAISLVAPSARGVADRWMSQYRRVEGGWGKTAGGPSEDIHERICALGPTPDPNAVAAIIGNKSWTHPRCSACNDECELAASFVQSWAEGGLIICEACIDEAKAVFDTARTAKARGE